MCRKDSLILLSNNTKKRLKVLDDEGEEIEVEYVDEHKNNDFFMQIEEIDHKNKEKTIKDDENDDYVVIFETKNKGFMEKFIKKIEEIKINQERNNMEKKRNIGEEMGDLKKFYEENVVVN